MTIDSDRLVLVGFSRTLLAPLADELPADCVVVIEEPDIAERRDLDALIAGFPAVGRVIRWNYQDHETLTELLRAAPWLQGARAVLPGVEYAVRSAAELAAMLGLPGAGVTAGAVFRDKARQRQVAAAAGLRNPEHALVRVADDAIAFLRASGGTCVVKPTARQASLGVRFARTAEQVREAVAAASDVHESLLEPGRGVPSQVLIETAVKGREYSVEMLVSHGRPCFANVTAKRLAAGDFPIEMGHVVAGLPEYDDLARRLVDGTERLAAASQFRDGILHCEWIADQKGPVLIECAARMPGDEIGTLISLAYGFPLPLAYLKVLLGETPEVRAEPCGAAAIRFLTAAPGVVSQVTGIGEARQAPGIQAVKISAGPGEVVRAPVSSWDRAGYVIACGSDPAQAEERAQAAAGLIQFSTVPGD